MSNILANNINPRSGNKITIGNVNTTVAIAGTATYEDVTSIDSVGIITARSGVNVTGGQLNVGSNIKIGNAGVITATSFSGDGSALTGIAGTANVSTNTLNVIGVSTFNGSSYVKDLFMGDVSPELRFTDSDENPDYRIRLNSGLLGIRDITNNVDKMVFSTAGVNIPVSNVGVQTNFPTSSTLVGAASSLIGLYIGDGHLLFSDNLSRSGGYYIPSGLNALNAGPVTLGSTMTLDGVWVIV